MSTQLLIQAVSRRHSGYPWTCSECALDRGGFYLVNQRVLCSGHALYDITAIMAAMGLEADLQNATDLNSSERDRGFTRDEVEPHE